MQSRLPMPPSKSKVPPPLSNNQVPGPEISPASWSKWTHPNTGPSTGSTAFVSSANSGPRGSIVEKKVVGLVRLLNLLALPGASQARPQGARSFERETGG